MGCCESRGFDSKVNRIARWRSTGIVAIRDAKLKILSANLIERLPINLGKLQSLKVMVLDGNQTTSLRDELGQLVRLERLSISGNMLMSFSETIGSLRNLGAAFLWKNCKRMMPPNILKDCKALQNISLHDNPISMDQFQQMDGFEEFEARRKKKFNKQINANVMISSKGFDVGVDL